MASDSREPISPHESDGTGTPFSNTALSDLGSNNVLTVRDYDKCNSRKRNDTMADEEVQDLKRENFNLKLRIYFLEEQHHGGGGGGSGVSITTGDYQTRTTYVNQLEHEIEQLRRRVLSQSTQSEGPQTVYNFDYEDERRAFREELDKYRKENEVLRQSLQSFKALTLSRDKSALTSSVDSALDRTTSASTTFLNSSSVQVELSETKERERKLQEQISALRRQLDSSLPQTSDFNKIRAELDQARRQIQQYEAEIHNYQQRQSKSERVLERLQSEYESQIARLVARQHEQIGTYEKVQQEPLIARIRFSYPLQDRESSSINIDEYQRAMENRDRIIYQLEEAISEITTRLRTPFTLMLPTQSSIDWQDDHRRSLVLELNTQMQSHLETVEQLRAECVELRQSEKHLRNQIEGLTHMIQTPVRNPELPPLPRPSSSKNYESIEEAKQLDTLQTAVVHITLQLRSDAENVSGLTNRVAQIIRERQEWQARIDRLQEELQEKNTRILQLERRERESETQIRQQFTLQIESLHRDVKSLQDQLIERDRHLVEIRQERDELLVRVRQNYEKFDSTHIQEKQKLQGQLRELQEFRVQIEQQLVSERRRSEELQRQYEQAMSKSGTHVEQMEREIQLQHRQIETFNSQIRQMEIDFQNERRQFERERNSEREKVTETQSSFTVINRRYAELQAEYDRIRGHSSDELETLKRENLTLRETVRISEAKLHDAIKRGEEFKSQVTVYEHRVRDTEDIDRRARTENVKLQREVEELTRERETITREMSEIRRKFELVKTDYSSARAERERFEMEIRTISQENAQLKREVEDITVRIRVQLQAEFENEYRQLIARSEKELASVERSTQTVRLELEQSNSEKARLTERLQAVEYNLRQANQSVEAYETDIKRLRQVVSESQERTEQIELTISRKYSSELKLKTDRVQELESKYQTLEIQSAQYERTVADLRQEKIKLIERYEQLQRDFEQVRHEHQRQIDATEKRSTSVYEERVRREVLIAIESKQELIRSLEDQLRDRDNHIRKLQHEFTAYESKDVRASLEIRIEELRQEIERQERTIQTCTQTIRERDQQLDTLRERNQESERKVTQMIESLQVEIQKRDRRIEQITNDKQYDIGGFERRISELQTIVIERERALSESNDKLREIERAFETQSYELRNCRQRYENLHINLNVAVEENDSYSDRILALEKELESVSIRNKTTEQVRHLEGIVVDLKTQLRQREDSIEGLQHTIADCDRQLKEVRHTYQHLQSEHSRMQLRCEQMEKQTQMEIESREKLVAALRQKLVEEEQRPRPSVIGALVPKDPSWEIEIRRRDEVIAELKQKLEQATRTKSPILSTITSSHYSRRTNVQRPASTTETQFNYEELKYELETLRKQNEDLVQQVARAVSTKNETSAKSSAEYTRFSTLQRDLQHQLTDRDEQIRKLVIQISDLRKAHEVEISQHTQKYERVRLDLSGDLNGKQNELRQAQLQIDMFKATKLQLEQAQDQNQRLHNEIKILQSEMINKKELIAHYDKQISLLEAQLAARREQTSETTIIQCDLSPLMEEMRQLRQDFERSINRQNELQIRLEESIRLSRAPREFSFSGRGTSYPDLRIVESSTSAYSDRYAFTSTNEEKRSGPLGASMVEFETERLHLDRAYVVGDLEDHENLRRAISEVKIQLKAIEVKIQEKLRSNSTSHTADPSIEWLEQRLSSLHQCLVILERTYQLIESYRTSHLPVKGASDSQIAEQNKELRASLSKCTQELQTLKHRHREQSSQLQQTVTHLTKANHKKANTDDYLALLLRPTLDALQKARSNMEHHLTESNQPQPTPSRSLPSHRRRRPTRLD